MSIRKQFLNVPATDPTLAALLEQTKDQIVSEEELREQRVSFAFGNALNLDRITKDSVHHASMNIRLTA